MPFLYQTQSDDVVFTTIFLDLDKNLVIKWEHVISKNDIIAFNETFKTSSTAVVELENIDKTTYEEAIVRFLTFNYLKKN